MVHFCLFVLWIFNRPRAWFVQQHQRQYQFRFTSTRGVTEIATKNVEAFPHIPPVCSVTSGCLPEIGLRKGPKYDKSHSAASACLHNPATSFPRSPVTPPFPSLRQIRSLCNKATKTCLETSVPEEASTRPRNATKGFQEPVTQHLSQAPEPHSITRHHQVPVDREGRKLPTKAAAAVPPIPSPWRCNGCLLPHLRNTA
jgi:hypothetical protein